MASNAGPNVSDEPVEPQNVETYINRLKELFKGLRVQQDELMKTSLDVIDDIDVTTAALQSPQNTEGMEKLNKYINNVRIIIEKCEKLNEKSHVLNNFLEQANASIDKIYECLNKWSESHVALDLQNKNVNDSSK